NQRSASLLNIINKYYPDVVLIWETKLNHVLRFENYDIIRNDRNDPHRGGGTAILMKRSISHTYAKCGTQKEFIPELDNLFKELKLNDFENYYILAGDLNAKHTDWRNKINNPRGVSFRLWLQTNELKYRSILLCSKYLSYPNGQSFLDLVLADARLKFQVLEDDVFLTNIPYDSDHNALLYNVEIESEDEFLLDANNPIRKFNYKKANWEKFNSHLEQNFNIVIPNDRNLNINEINTYLQNIDDAITDAMAINILRIKFKNPLKSYINDTIRNLQNEKSKLLTQIHRLNRKWPLVNFRRLKQLKKEINKIKEQLKTEFSKSISNYWKEKISNITKQDSAKMFPKINSIFRKNDPIEISSLKLDSNSDTLISAKIDTIKLITDTNGNVLVENIQDKLDVLGAHFASVNNRKIENNRPHLNELIDSQINAFKNSVSADRENNVLFATSAVIIRRTTHLVLRNLPIILLTRLR
ncbi:PREDICTED: uncharacterized protein LOC108778109, partial [Cyphomyrmex costatus]|uniref:uncharacterized protein LOC108778109 n=1 Tax=Cyphomyrmex costatus TaxID=456900 RepID=UPI0008522159